MSGNYLQVIVSQIGNDLVVISANNISLERGKTNYYPLVSDYFAYLENQGWQMVSSNTLTLNRIVYTFRGGYGYKVSWEGNRWYGEDMYPRYDFEDGQF